MTSSPSPNSNAGDRAGIFMPVSPVAPEPAEPKKAQSAPTPSKKVGGCKHPPKESSRVGGPSNEYCPRGGDRGRVNLSRLETKIRISCVCVLSDRSEKTGKTCPTLPEATNWPRREGRGTPFAKACLKQPVDFQASGLFAGLPAGLRNGGKAC